jgi:hypothetical protein
MIRRLALLSAVSLVPALLAAVPQQAAGADPVPVDGDVPWCMDAPGPKTYLTVVPDDDNRYCVWSIEKDPTGTGVWEDLQPVPYGEPGHAGLHDDVWVYSWDAHDAFAWALNTRELDSAGNEVGAPINETDVNVRWRIKINTGAMVPREMRGVTQDNDFSVAPLTAGNSRLTVTFRAAPIAWRWSFDPGIPNPTCVPGDCGDDTTVADLVSDGFFNSYVTDLDDYPAHHRDYRTGMVTGWNADYGTEPQYNADLNALEIQLANAHLKAPGVPATGHYEAFLPNAYLINVMQVPDPSTLTAGSLVVSRAGTSTVYTPVVTHEAGGIRIKVTGITYSSLKLRIKPKPSIPGKPRWGSVQRPTPTKVKLNFLRPLADGGPNITTYQARCRRGTAPYRYAKGSASPLYIGDLPRRQVDCQVRAQNRIGWGRWSAVKSG